MATTSGQLVHAGVQGSPQEQSRILGSAESFERLVSPRRGNRLDTFISIVSYLAGIGLALILLLRLLR